MRKALLAALPLALVLSTGHLASAQRSGSTPGRDTASRDTGGFPARDPETIAALNRMGASLQQLRNFTLRADITREDVLDSGQKIQYSGTVTVRAQRPTAFRIDIESERQNRSIFYDGSNLTVVAPRAGYYATVAQTGPIQSLVGRLRDEYGIDLPLADLFAAGSSDLQARITTAFPIATEVINGQRCEQHAARQPGVDWQVWIREGANALPCKLVITTTDDPSMPQYTAVLTWEPAQTFAAGTFTYTPAQDSRRIALGTVPDGPSR